MAHVDLVHDDLRLAAAPLVELDDVKAAGRAHRIAHLSRLHPGHEVQDELRHLGAFAPSELAAVQRRLAVRIGNGQLAEILALLGAIGDFLRLLGGLIELLRGGRRGQGQQDVRYVEFVVGRASCPGARDTGRVHAESR